MHPQLFSAAALLSAVAAFPTVKRADSCTFTDASSAKDGVSDCSDVVLKDIEVPAGETLDLSDAEDGTTFTFEGTTTFGYKEWKGPLIRFEGSDITIKGAEGHLIDGDGSRWWDGEGSNGGKTKPKFFYAHKMENSKISGLNFKNAPVQLFSINQAHGLEVNDLTFDNSDGDAKDCDGEACGHNSDAFDIGESSNIHINGANVKNQDDCMAVNSGYDINFTGGTCSGGHGLSIGSVGGRDNNTVQAVTVSDSTIKDSTNGMRIKVKASSEKGFVDDITYKDITLENISRYGIKIQQDYENDSPTGDASGNIPITNVHVDGITGSVTDDGQPVYILCNDGGCSDWTWSGVDISGGEQSDECENVPSAASC